MQCKAKSKRSGKQCKRYATPGHTVCHIHGSKTPKGLAAPNLTRGGIYSKHLPAKLLGSYQNLLTLGQDLFKIDDETAAMTTLIQQQLERMEAGESGATWGKLQGVHSEMAILGQKQDKSSEDIKRFNELFTELGDIISGSLSAYMAQAEAVALIEQKRKLVADERKSWAAKHQAMSFDRVLLILTAFAASFKQSLEKHISDDKRRRSVLSDTQAFLEKVIGE